MKNISFMKVFWLFIFLVALFEMAPGLFAKLNGQNWILLLFVVFVLLMASRNKLLRLGILVLAVIFLFKYDDINSWMSQFEHISASKAKESEQALRDYANRTDPTSTIRQGTDVGTALDQERLNRCLQTAAGANHLGPKMTACVGVTGPELEKCLVEKVFNSADEAGIAAKDECYGYSSTAPGELKNKVNEERSGILVALACGAIKLLNKLPGVDYDTSRCPE